MTPTEHVDFNDATTIAYRLGRVEHAVDVLDDTKADKEFVARVIESVGQLGSDLSGLRHTIIMCALGASGSVVVAAIGDIILAHAK